MRACVSLTRSRAIFGAVTFRAINSLACVADRLDLIRRFGRYTGIPISFIFPIGRPAMRYVSFILNDSQFVLISRSYFVLFFLEILKVIK